MVELYLFRAPDNLRQSLATMLRFFLACVATLAVTLFFTQASKAGMQPCAWIHVTIGCGGRLSKSGSGRMDVETGHVALVCWF